MNRRDFCKGIGGLVTTASMSLLAGSGCNIVMSLLAGKAEATGPYDHLKDTDPRAGFNLVPPSLFLFLDRRYIDPGELIWRHPDGEILDLHKPEGKPVRARSDLDITPRGLLCIEAMPATREILKSPPPYNIIYDGMYRAWSLRQIEGATLEDTKIGISYRQSTDGYEWKDIGLIVGLLLALSTARIVANKLYDVNTTDPISMILTILLLGIAFLVAGYFPARRAARIDPMEALRYE